MEEQTEQTSESFAQIALSIWNDVILLFQSVVTPGWRQNQFFIILALIGIAWLLRYITDGRIENWARSREGWEKWQFRVLVQVRRRLILIYFAGIAWTTYFIMQEVT